MRILIDTNVLISAALFPSGQAARAYEKAMAAPFEPMISQQNISELSAVFTRKFPDKMLVLHNFLASMHAVMLVDIPNEAIAPELAVRDLNDRPILRAAIAAGANIILTGDRDFLESGISNPIILSPRQFMEFDK